MKMFNDDPQTEAVIMVGEIGGSDEEECARWIKDNMKKPVVGFIAGVTAPPGKRMGHAGAIISGGKGTAAEKLAVMEECGIKVTQKSGGNGQAAQVGTEVGSGAGIEPAGQSEPVTFHTRSVSLFRPGA